MQYSFADQEAVMNITSPRFTHRWAAVLVLTGFATPTMADRHDRHEYQNPQYATERYQREDHGDYRKHEVRDENRFSHERFFNDDHRTIVREYFNGADESGRCPPGLKRKHNHCQPPGRARRWLVGRPLPRDVLYYDLPPTVVQQIGYPPTGYRFVRVAGDILLISIGTGIVMDAIADFNGR